MRMGGGDFRVADENDARGAAPDDFQRLFVGNARRAARRG
jgi:hypothetical protein